MGMGNVVCSRAAALSLAGIPQDVREGPMPSKRAGATGCYRRLIALPIPRGGCGGLPALFNMLLELGSRRVGRIPVRPKVPLGPAVVVHNGLPPTGGCPAVQGPVGAQNPRLSLPPEFKSGRALGKGWLPLPRKRLFIPERAPIWTGQARTRVLSCGQGFIGRPLIRRQLANEGPCGIRRDRALNPHEPANFSRERVHRPYNAGSRVSSLMRESLRGVAPGVLVGAAEGGAGSAGLGRWMRPRSGSSAPGSARLCARLTVGSPRAGPRLRAAAQTRAATR
jgi:hypothetical protein